MNDLTGPTATALPRTSHTSNMYGAFASQYLDAGWLSPIPLPQGQKFPPPTGWTGRTAPYPGRAQIEKWENECAAGNLGLRLHDGVIAVDVDNAHEGKVGAITLADFEAVVGVEFPSTWTSTSRSDGSEQRFYRVPAELTWPSKLPGNDVEVIHSGHRYSVVYPSVHPDTGEQYRWRDPEGNVSLVPPSPGSLSELPTALVEALTANAAQPTEKASRRAATRLLDGLPGGPMSKPVAVLLGNAVRDLAGSRHENTRTNVDALLRLGEQGETGVNQALGILRAAFVEAINNPDRKAGAEFDRLVQSGARLIAGDPTTKVQLEGLQIASVSLAPGGYWYEQIHNGGLGDDAEAIAQERIKSRRRMKGQQLAKHDLAVEGWEMPPQSEEILVELAKDPMPVQFAVQDLAPVGSNVLLVAEAKAGKTTLVMNLVVSMVTGSKFLGKYEIGSLPEGSSITYSNFELEKSMSENWIRDMGMEGAARHHHRLFLDPWKGYKVPLPADHVEDHIVDLLVSRQSSVWVIDPYGAAINHDENSNDDTRAWTNAIDRIARRAGLSLVVLAAHSGSSSANGGDIRVRGAYRLEDWMSVKWSYTHGGVINQTPPDNLRYLAARGRDVAVPLFTLDYEVPTRRLFVTSEKGNKSENETERWALEAYKVVLDHEESAKQRGEAPGHFKAGDFNDALGISPTDSKPGGKGKLLKAGRSICVARNWLVEQPGPGNSKLYSVGPVDPHSEGSAWTKIKAAELKVNVPE
ncbi:AAA family ATPase [Rhodococcus sp. ZPP]|uniref:AAA family ATPase n=1 Tax=Rhodococcus sp. ZPP TaxID=2749906 RepID=UPI001AD8946B|nr:AAA family ATPase [Rhodococcus sp. ZPP]QTJ67946.1 AAA family ATPase [Rhodococcus sp. ZPP]